MSLFSGEIDEKIIKRLYDMRERDRRFLPRLEDKVRQWFYRTRLYERYLLYRRRKNMKQLLRRYGK